LARAVPMWGAIGEGGFEVLTWRVVKQGRFKQALRRLSAGRTRGPWTALCDNEYVLEAKLVKAAYARQGVSLRHIPPRSPNLNPIEKFWSWLRRHLRSLDLADLKAKRAPATPEQLRRRVRSVCRSQKATTVARNCFKNLRKACRKVVAARGGACPG